MGRQYNLLPPEICFNYASRININRLSIQLLQAGLYHYVISS
jgi:hypothetical protein